MLAVESSMEEAAISIQPPSEPITLFTPMRVKQRALERHAAGEARVIPIILRPIDWRHDLVLSRPQALPTDGKPITDCPSPPHYDAAFENIARGIRKVVEDLLNGRSSSPYAREASGPDASEKRVSVAWACRRRSAVAALTESR
ncbi:MAG: hypothetical protein J2P36_21140 [Ktedonobacteraceae bacterium]|nr:hypothetical protein [Ktedonobacteraceae bacterium]